MVKLETLTSRNLTSSAISLNDMDKYSIRKTNIYKGGIESFFPPILGLINESQMSKTIKA